MRARMAAHNQTPEANRRPASRFGCFQMNVDPDSQSVSPLSRLVGIARPWRCALLTE